MKVSTVAGLLAFLTLLDTACAFIGMGITMYKPICAFGCRAAIASAMLSCSDHSKKVMTSPSCRAGDTPFLTTLAWCMNATCSGGHHGQTNDKPVPVWKLEKYWASKATGDASVLPKWSYADALAEIKEPPTQEWRKGKTLNFTARVSHSAWDLNVRTLSHFELAEERHNRYAVILAVVGFGTPIFFTLLNGLPYMTGLFERLKPYLVYPSTVGTYHVRSLPYLLGNPPTVGQGAYIAMFFVLNVILTAVGYTISQPNTIFDSSYQEVMGYVSARTGALAFGLAPLVFLFAGRNNFLLWVTNWSHSTYMLLHRWVARIFAIQVILHSITELVVYIDMGKFEVETKKPYWVWGIVATLFVCIMLVASLLWVRRWSYEVFLISHIIMALFVIVGSWYHIELLFTRKWGYEFWMYACCAVWFFDRLLRVLRIVKNGIRSSNVTEVSEDIVRIDVPDVRWTAAPGRHTYAYFPSLRMLRPWENHPFSVVPTALLRLPEHRLSKSTPTKALSSASSSNGDVEKSGMPATTTTTPIPEPHGRSERYTTSGITLYVRKSTGITSYLKSNKQLTTLLDGPYPNNHTGPVLKSDRLILIAGGIGIAGILPFVACHTNAKLYWSVRQTSEGLVNELQTVLDGLQEKEVRVGRRLEIERLLEQEEQDGWKKIGVVVCGPGGLCDDVRALVAAKGRQQRGVLWELEVDAFSW
ncbi:hypothetical protein LOZ53_000674 [Ophidiomyces ophidiicola]|uniref:Uncharacterized protein n=1 Tax=Ophidiomyces ophidiicola TaxID=1387563 RepID=A0ACB8V5H4_9EURO|nr:uncharacterized protein LOZ57_003084 [Ophidiomyces ophidiicola]KAI1908919.1 hypothetical protein LOZ61_005332 [Ophidiomyces ophidiicola]KAI1923672.1 hypothetical protein LOZ64_000931 [Ophidiomyces ophidiicola]KAI1923907.1 hypothetical protein LOZ60_004978 [Ophidiomyces ophidiicola]KAI1947932.1 hypothetical protein LOZ57_003084 [Ophidiomyces ophidiicola]KAI1956076.1 hypothetical protein LOZ62_000068 [Ophidiomyces ophidiicola]